MVANLESEIRKLYEVGGLRFRVALLRDRDSCVAGTRLRLNPQLRRIPPELRAELTSGEIAMSGSYLDDVLRDPRRYGIENTTDKERRPGAVRHDATPCALHAELLFDGIRKEHARSAPIGCLDSCLRLIALMAPISRPPNRTAPVPRRKHD